MSEKYFSTSSHSSILLGGGCFWCMEAIFKDLKGVESVKSGYAGGTTPDPTYEQVCTGTTHHAEVVKLDYNPEEISLEDILYVFFTMHDPTSLNRQGNDVGTQYRSAVYTHSSAESQRVKDVMKDMSEHEKLWSAPMVTEVRENQPFFPAEISHDDYFARNPQSGYCQAVVAPKVAKFRQKFASKLKK